MSQRIDYLDAIDSFESFPDELLHVIFTYLAASYGSAT